ncbi:Phage minor tail protein U [uncultured Mediterranean phage uvMED]|nr:Phage minor tail protein U [uncultured Mediterranean phage uvMED]BAR21166.1 phage tail protein [uncultured Mediterranean phage uvMED]BAR21908.1 phage tail protein [uncultured Mediterranean phage uvMED]BAR21967.1 phage tail protein [uncultured Mediterranean phage uvMED]BAR21973.1 phage tail protein [uncultured Mediterranean phage uvMED]
MTLVNARAAFETAIKNAVTTADNTVTVVFDNMPFSAPGKTKKYVMVNLDFTQSTTQPQGGAIDYYSGSIRCAIMTPSNKGSAVAAAIAESVIDGMTSVNASGYSDTFSVTPRVSQVSGPTSVVSNNQSHFMSVVNCNFSANA